MCFNTADRWKCRRTAGLRVKDKKREMFRDKRRMIASTAGMCDLYRPDILYWGRFITDFMSVLVKLHLKGAENSICGIRYSKAMPWGFKLVCDPYVDQTAEQVVSGVDVFFFFFFYRFRGNPSSLIASSCTFFPSGGHKLQIRNLILKYKIVDLWVLSYQCRPGQGGNYRLFVSAEKNPHPIRNLQYHHFPMLFILSISFSHYRAIRGYIDGMNYVTVQICWSVVESAILFSSKRALFILLLSFAGEWIFLDLLILSLAALLFYCPF